MSTPILKSFTFVPQPKVSSDPVVIKRERMISRLDPLQDAARTRARLLSR